MRNLPDWAKQVQQTLAVFIETPTPLHYRAFSDALGELGAFEDDVAQRCKDSIDHILMQTFCKDIAARAHNLRTYQAEINRLLSTLV